MRYKIKALNLFGFIFTTRKQLENCNIELNEKDCIWILKLIKKEFKK